MDRDPGAWIEEDRSFICCRIIYAMCICSPQTTAMRLAFTMALVTFASCARGSSARLRNTGVSGQEVDASSGKKIVIVEPHSEKVGARGERGRRPEREGRKSSSSESGRGWLHVPTWEAWSPLYIIALTFVIVPGFSDQLHFATYSHGCELMNSRQQNYPKYIIHSMHCKY